MPKKKRVLYPVLFMIAITAVFTLVLALINELSTDRIEKQEMLKTQTKLLNSLNIEYEVDDESIIQTFNKYISQDNIDDIDFYTASDSDSIIGYGFSVKGPGLWGSIEAFIALDSNFEYIKGVDFITHSETPGLGGRIDEKWFLEQFRDISIKDNTDENHLVFKPSIGGNVDSISGATITSKAVLKLFNDNLNEILKLKEDII